VIPLPQEVPRRPAQLDQGNATARLAQMVGDLRQWILEFPYELHGELAVIARLFRELEARRVSLKTAGELGRTVAPDVIDEMAYTPGVVSGR
jgi:hypothetical protein